MPLLISCVLVGCSLQPEATPEHTQYDLPQQQAYVVRVIDGDTVEVRMEDDTIEHVRVLGIDAPETHGGKHPDCYADAATQFLKKEIDQSFITLIPEPQDNRDKYGRLLRYIEYEGVDIGARMLKDGYAKNYPWFPHPRLDAYTEIGSSAEQKEVGLWGECG